MATFAYPFICDCLATPVVLLQSEAATCVMHETLWKSHESGVKAGALGPGQSDSAICLLQEFVRIKECSHSLSLGYCRLLTCIETFLFTFPSPLVAFIVVGVLRLIALPQTLIILFTAMTDTMLWRRLCRGSRGGARGTL
jgi:hypothetical protein